MSVVVGRIVCNCPGKLCKNNIYIKMAGLFCPEVDFQSSCVANIFTQPPGRYFAIKPSNIWIIYGTFDCCVMAIFPIFFSKTGIYYFFKYKPS